MGLFDKKECCICGGKAGMLTRTKLMDGSFLCGDCVAKCSPNLDYKAFSQMGKDKVLAAMQNIEESEALYQNQFQATETIANIVEVDRRNNWWTIKNQRMHDVIRFDQIASWQLILDTVAKSEEEMKEMKPSVMPPRSDMPTCRSDHKISKMYIRVTLNHPILLHIDVNVMTALIVTEYDIQEGYRKAFELYSLFESAKYQAQANMYAQPAAAAAAPASVADELKKFKELLDMGILTQEEFDAKKRQLLGL